VAIEVAVPIVLVGEAIELSREGGIVEHHLNELTVLAKPNAIPNEFEVDITDLTSHNPIKVSAITLPAGVTTEVDPDELIAAGFIPRGVVAEGEEGEGGEAGEGGEGAEAAPEAAADSDASD
jgi:large subunit ribosomal protein L25